MGVLRRIAAQQHLALALLTAWLVLTSPWVHMFRRIPRNAGFLDYAHIGLGLLALALAPDDPTFWEQELVRPTPFVPEVVILLFELLRMAGLALFVVLAAFSFVLAMHAPGYIIVHAFWVITLVLVLAVALLVSVFTAACRWITSKR